MGAIQNSINGMLGAAAGAALAYKHSKDVKAKDEEQGLLAQEQYHEASADLKALEGESKAAEKKLAGANKAVEATKG